MKREFEKRIITVFDQIMGKNRDFKEGSRVMYVGHFYGTIMPDFSVMLDDGCILENVIHNQPHKIVEI